MLQDFAGFWFLGDCWGFETWVLGIGPSLPHMLAPLAISISAALVAARSTSQIKKA